METIAYNWKIVSVDDVLKTCVVEYTAEGYPTAILNLKLPIDREKLISTIENAAPIQMWLSKDKPADQIAEYNALNLVELAGAATYMPKAEASPDELFNQRVTDVLVNLGLVAKPAAA